MYLFQSVNKFPFPNKNALKYIHTFVTRTSMTAFDHNFNTEYLRIIAQLLPQNNTTVIFLTFGISPQFFYNQLKILPQSNTIKRCRQKCNQL